MNFVWHDYDPETMGYVENWLDDSAVTSTGLDEGFESFYKYWANEDGFVIGENFWCKVAFSGDTPLAVIAFCQHKGSIMIMQIVVAPEKRGQGIGTKLLKELLESSEILGASIHKSEAVIYPDNIASQKAFENAGFQHFRTHEDENGKSMYYIYERGSKEESSYGCGHM